MNRTGGGTPSTSPGRGPHVVVAGPHPGLATPLRTCGNPPGQGLPRGKNARPPAPARRRRPGGDAFRPWQPRTAPGRGTARARRAMPDGPAGARWFPGGSRRPGPQPPPAFDLLPVRATNSASAAAQDPRPDDVARSRTQRRQRRSGTRSARRPSTGSSASATAVADLLLDVQWLADGIADVVVPPALPAFADDGHLLDQCPGARGEVVALDGCIGRHAAQEIGGFPQGERPGEGAWDHLEHHLAVPPGHGQPASDRLPRRPSRAADGHGNSPGELRSRPARARYPGAWQSRLPPGYRH